MRNRKNTNVNRLRKTYSFVILRAVAESTSYTRLLSRFCDGARNDSLLNPLALEKYLQRGTNMGNVESKYDGWLDRHFAGLAGNLTVIELGCGIGDDTSFLSGTGHTVISCDIDGDRIAIVKEKCPGVTALEHDLRDPFPFGTASADIVVASLCLHFFEEPVLRGILAEIRRVLKKGGTLLCRLNSEKGFKPGVAGETELAPGLYMTGGGLKQFYNEDRIRAAFSDWDILSIEEYETAKFSKQVILFEIVMVPGNR